MIPWNSCDAPSLADQNAKRTPRIATYSIRHPLGPRTITQESSPKPSTPNPSTGLRTPLEHRTITFGSSSTTWTTPSFTTASLIANSSESAQNAGTASDDETKQGGESASQLEGRSVFVKVTPSSPSPWATNPHPYTEIESREARVLRRTEIMNPDHEPFPVN